MLIDYEEDLLNLCFDVCVYIFIFWNSSNTSWFFKSFYSLTCSNIENKNHLSMEDSSAT